MLVRVDPQDEAARKKVDYQVAKFSQELDLERGNAGWLLTASDEISDLVRELAARMGRDKLRVFKLVEVDLAELGVQRATRSIQEEFSTSKGTIESFLIGYLMISKRGAPEIPSPHQKHRRFKITTSKGVVEVMALVTGSTQRARVEIEFEGDTDAVQLLEAQIRKELDLFRRGLDA